MAWADADGPDFYQVHGVAPGHVLNLRAGPGSASHVIGRIPSGATCLKNQGCQGGLSFEEFTQLPEADKKRKLKENPRWCKMEYQGLVGWVAGRYLAEGACTTQSITQE